MVWRKQSLRIYWRGSMNLSLSLVQVLLLLPLRSVWGMHMWVKHSASKCLPSLLTCYLPLTKISSTQHIVRLWNFALVTVVPGDFCNVINSQEYNIWMTPGDSCAWPSLISSPLDIWSHLVRSSYLLWCRWQFHAWIHGEANQGCLVIWGEDAGIAI